MARKRIVVIDRELCQGKKCGYQCQKACPKNRAGEECITIERESKFPVVNEEICIGCSLCAHRCEKLGYRAMSVVNLPEKLKGNPIHRYGKNLFCLFGLPVPKLNAVVGLIGQNGVGKSSVLNIVSGRIKPNCGLGEASWEEIIERFRGTELQGYLEKLSGNGVRVAHKPQNVDMIPKAWSGKVGALLKKSDEKKGLGKVMKDLEMEEMLEKDIKSLSGGELQLLAIAATLLKDRDFYFFDEPSSYLDVRERLLMAREIRKLSEKAIVMVVEHDLAIADYLADYVHILFGKPAVFGIVSKPYGVRVGINTYLEGYIREENMRFRPESITFSRVGRVSEKRNLLLEFPGFEKIFKGFRLGTEPGRLFRGEVIGILGPNAIGKSTFIKLLVGQEKPDRGKGLEGFKLSYKPQRLLLDAGEKDMTVRELLRSRDLNITKKENKGLLRFLGVEKLLERQMGSLSGGELQSVFILSCLLEDRDIILMDEPSAFLDVEQRLRVAKLLRQRAEDRETPIFVVDHDLQFLDSLADRLMVFEGEQGVKGHGLKPASLKEGMNRFLKSLSVTFRRDPATGRPRANKPGSQLDREQKRKGQYFYSG